MNPKTYFADTVAAGWRPRHPCTDERELATLHVAHTRGDCISPLVLDGDLVYIDRNMKPEPGDVVDFALSARGAATQNSGKAEGRLLHQPVWERGARWCKLYGERHGLQMLYDRHGREATATLMTCESPNDTPVLYPVRQIRRNGRLLYGALAASVLTLSGCNEDAMPLNMLPACTETTNSAEIENNAATVLNIVQNGSATLPAGLYENATTVTVGPFPYLTSVIITATGTWEMQTGANADLAFISVYIDTFPETSGSFGVTVVRDPTITYQAANLTRYGSWAYEYTFSLPINYTQSYVVKGYATYSYSTSTAYLQGVTMKAEVIKR